LSLPEPDKGETEDRRQKTEEDRHRLERQSYSLFNLCLSSFIYRLLSIVFYLTNNSITKFLLSMKQKMIFLALTLWMLSAASVQAQVLIGGNATENPTEGALLDLHNTETYNGGLLLPRVALTDLESLVDISGVSKDAMALIGLTVYNTTPWTEGIYTWNGYKWNCTVSMIRDCSFAQDAEGNYYYAAQFGNAGCWMTQNLRSTKTLQGGIEQNLTEDKNESHLNLPYYYYPSASKDTFDTYPEYGLLYTWAAANIGAGSGDTSDAFPGMASTRQGICPSGWYLPSDYDWSQLEKEIATNPGNYSSQTTAYANAGSFDYGGTTTWRPSNSTNNTYWGRQMKSMTAVAGIATNGSSNSCVANGFDALLVGCMLQSEKLHYNFSAYFWSSSYTGVGSGGYNIYAWARYLGAGMSGVYRSNYWVDSHFSVRCKK
jgi:uncharacterized protein (TIGR02145 family)